MKRTLILLLILIVNIDSVVMAQHPSLDYLNTLETNIGNGLSIKTKASTLDHQGNLIVTGVFRGALDIDPSENNYILTNQYSQSPNIGTLFMAKYTPGGELLWGIKIGGNNVGSCTPETLSVDHNGNIIVSGTYRYEVDFDPGPGEAIEYALARHDGFICKYRGSNGALVWKNHIYNSGDLKVSSHSTNLNFPLISYGNTVVTGSFKDIVSFVDVNGQTELLYTDTPGMTDGYMAELNVNGEWIRVQKVGYYGKNVDVKTIDHYSNTNVLLGLRVSDSTHDVTLLNVYDANWNKSEILALSGLSALSPTTFELQDLDIDRQDGDRIYMTGNFKGIVEVKNGPVILTNMSSYYDSYLLKVSSTGHMDWVKHIRGTSPGVRVFQATHVTADDEEIFLAGKIRGTYDILNLYGLSEAITSSGNSPVACMIKYQSGGTVSWNHIFESSLKNEINSINKNGTQIYLFGTFEGLTEFNPDPNQSTTINVTNSSKDFFIGKYLDDVSSDLSKRMPEIPAKDHKSSLMIYPDGHDTYKIKYLPKMMKKDDALAFQISNTLGQVVYNGFMKSEDGSYVATVDLGRNESGVYIVKAFTTWELPIKRFFVR